MTIRKVGRCESLSRFLTLCLVGPGVGRLGSTEDVNSRDLSLSLSTIRPSSRDGTSPSVFGLGHTDLT